MWDSVETVETIGRISTWLAAAFGFLAGIAGIAAVLANARVDTLRDELKRTPPIIDAMLTLDTPGTFVATVESKNLVPFSFTVTLVTLGGHVLGGVPLESASFQPTQQNRVASVTRQVDPFQIREGYLEVRVRYRSKYQDELPNLKLSGYLAKAFCYAEDRGVLAPCPVRGGG